MGFIDSHKHLEKLCGEVLNDDRRISAYIDEMLNTPNGSYLVNNWDDDLKQLKHYRWIRNQIAHEPGCSEYNMCNPSDTLWIDDFHSRILSQRDPLALYYQATNPQKTSKPKTESQTNTYSQQSVNHNKRSHKPEKFINFFIWTLIIVAIIFFILKNM